MKFRAKILQNDKTATGIPIPPKILESLGAGKKPPVTITIKGYTYRSTVATVSGQYMVGLSAENREKAGVRGGDTVDVEIALDTAPREVSVPPLLQKALAKDAKAKKNFEALSYSNKKRYALLIESAKTDETLQRRLEKTLSELRAGKE